jgi:EAL domain-containing protein (putative c-di-GMP-specific phosphodiesterase class I)
MVNEEGDLIPPGVFIPAAERYGLMPAIDQWVVAHVFNFLHNYVRENGTENLPVLAINLSGESMGSEELLAYIRAQFELKIVPAANICFEITETAAIGNLNKAMSFINSLKKLGCKFALDDFGSGLSSFSYLKSLPVDYLKIDGVFVKDIVDDPVDAAMVAAINQVGHIMKIQTIAEFVENGEIMDILRKLGVDYAQGYHIDKPMSLYEKFPNAQQQGLKKTG